MGLEEKKRCFEILELSQDSSWPEIRKSYFNLKELYSKSSIVTMPVENELTEGRKENILQQIEKAYQELEEYYKSKKKSKEECVKSMLDGVDFFDGPSMKKIRKELNIDLLDISLATNIQISHLKNIEIEDYKSLPRDIYTRGYVMNYAKYLGIDPKKVAADYMQGYNEWSRRQGR